MDENEDIIKIKTWRQNQNMRSKSSELGWLGRLSKSITWMQALWLQVSGSILEASATYSNLGD